MAPSSKRRKLSDGSPAAPVITPATAMPQSPTSSVQALSTDTPKDKDKDNRRSLFVRSLPSSVTNTTLAAHFSETFPLKHATVVLDPATKISRGFGFVTFTDAADARAAAEQFDGSTLEGRKIRVEVAESRHRDTDANGAEGVPRQKGQKGGGATTNTTGERLRKERELLRQETQGQPPKLIVRNLPWSVKTGDDLGKLFLSYGKVKHAVVPRRASDDEKKGQYGFGIVIIRGRKNAERALKGVNGKEVDGRVLAVDWAVEKEDWEKAKAKGDGEEATEATGEQSTVVDDDALEDGKDDEVHDAAPSDENIDDDSDAGINLSSIDEDDAEDETMEDASIEDEGPPKPDTSLSTVFIRNLPYDTDDATLREHFNQFGLTRYARVVYDHETERPRGTGFVCFVEEDAAKECVKNAPKKHNPLDAASTADPKARRRGEQITHSILQNEASDPTGAYTLAGRVLQVSRALPKADADRRAADGANVREKAREADKRRLYLLSEGTVPKGSKLYNSLSKTELDIREASAKQRQKLIKSNPNLGISLTRLSIRNLPRSIGSKELKALARQALVGFAQDVKEGKRSPLSAEEQKRGGEEMREAEKRRKEKGVGVVKQAKVVFEGKEGGKVNEGAGGRSRGYGFVEYWAHRSALAGLRWMNGHLALPKEGAEGERGKRLIVEFAIEDARVVQRRGEREGKAQRKRTEDGQAEESSKAYGGKNAKNGKYGNINPQDRRGKNDKKRKRVEEEVVKESKRAKVDDDEDKNKIAKRNRIISKKRHARKARKG
ncbi:uncharacterized protein HMPREF1541_08595 [Cyphellophora europaea CBS 101466]|uniref:RRM domain-containing protein n=1 Tax=Cyphellophora europaea (strain CBS 101466) TaxID=1220924 RepID=W2RKT0_CYPE1|nr:uncharacterized protein HMPREF1541_08595 [Cyphellophora europaea CBS 101466]ETN36318.1 hypothetical protein HMPREF1541_08595 [Cyphellophora europaea CBS 101466]